MAEYSFLDLAFDVLMSATMPLTYSEIWNKAKADGLSDKIRTTGKTPWSTLGAQLYVDVRDKEDSRFVKVGKRPARFFLASRIKELPANVDKAIEKAESKEVKSSFQYSERDLHPLLTYFVYFNLSFNRGRAIHTKTIYHEKSLKNGYNEWLHPDIVGFYLPLKEWEPVVIDLNRLSDNNAIRLFSFELKKSLNKSNYRESFFQAVSNSSWAHEGYLVAVEIMQDNDFLAELERLATSFGIGVIQLDPMSIDDSRILYPAKIKPSLDWEAINKLCEQNPDFKKFLQDVRIDFESKRIICSEYDKILSDADVRQYLHHNLGMTIDDYVNCLRR
ncbi:MAG: hypothetical protein HGB06_03710 [Chlorobaculum sp.]|nr:hypothetical protein [Chlorobaculum sp.]